MSLAAATALVSAQLERPLPLDGRRRTVTGLAYDSRLTQPGDLYVALPGSRRHGAEFAETAVRSGAVAILTDADGARHLSSLAGDRTVDVPVLKVADPRQAMAPLAAALHGRPSDGMTMLGITGTNGKTTTAYMTAAALRAAGRRVGVVGTIGFEVGGEPLQMERTTVTTPEAPELHALLARMADAQADTVVMEVSSHAVSLHRVDSISFDVCAFTNFGRDHLDFHGDLESYFAAKASLFSAEHTRHAVINIDDPWGAKLADEVRRGGSVGLSTVSVSDQDAPGPAGGRMSAADYRGWCSSVDLAGASMVTAMLPGERKIEFAVGLPGSYNVANALTAVALLDIAGVEVSVASAGLASALVPGRMEPVELDPPAPKVVVDFAHTPQAVSSVLSALAVTPSPSGRPSSSRSGRLVVVLGCGGDRDPDKRGPIGGAAARGADLVVVTDDNPRTEEPVSIRAAVLDGARAAIAHDGLSSQVIDGGDRSAAIAMALRTASAADTVVILGKGHERSQEVAGEARPFSDPDVVRSEWSRLQRERHQSDSAQGETTPNGASREETI